MPIYLSATVQGLLGGAEGAGRRRRRRRRACERIPITFSVFGPDGKRGDPHLPI